MASVVRQLEAAVMSALGAELGDAAKVIGERAYTQQGSVKTSDGDGRPEVIVAVAPAVADNYASPVISFDVAVAVRLEWADDPTIKAFDDTAEIVERLLMRYNDNANIATMSEALTTDNFRCDGLRLGGGQDNIDASGQRPAITTTFNFTVKGVYIETQTDTTNTNTQEG